MMGMQWTALYIAEDVSADTTLALAPYPGMYPLARRR